MASDAKQREVTVVRQLTKFEPGWKRHTLGAWFSVENPQNTPGEYLTVMPQPPGTCPVLLVKRTPEGLVMSVLPGTYMDRPHVGVRIVVSGDHAGMNQVYSIGLKRWATATAPIFVGCMLSPGDMKQRGATFAKRNPGTPFTLRAHVAIGYLTDLTSETVTVELVHSILGLDPVTVIKYPPAPPAKPDTARLTAIMEDGKLHGDIVFMVGTPPAPVRAFSAFLRQATSVNLTARGFSEDSSKEIPLPLMSLEVFHVWLSFVYLNDISDKDLATHALHLLPHAHLYLMDTLMHKCVEYLCFMLKSGPATVDAIAVLNAAETYECEELKRACVDYIFAERLRPLLEAPPDAIAPALHHELWRLATLRFDWTAAPRQPPAANDPGPTLKRPRTTT